MDSYQRDIVKSSIPNFKTVGYKGKSEPCLYTDGLATGKHLEDVCKSFILPSFNDLLCGLQNLPTGLDARSLTQCLMWYLQFRDSFTPRLDLNILHTQALIRALRQPLKPFGPQNLDCNALQEWRDRGSFENTPIQWEKQKSQAPSEDEQQQRTRLHLNLNDDSVKLDLKLPLRHVFTFPFLALHSVVGEALKMGIKRAESQKVARKKEERSQALEAKRSMTRGDEKKGCKEGMSREDTGTTYKAKQEVVEKEMSPYRIPKRSRPVQEDHLEHLPHLSTNHIPSTPTGRRSIRSPHTVPSSRISSRLYEHQASSSPSTSRLHRSEMTHASPPPFHATVYGRRDYQRRMSTDDYATAAPPRRNHAQREEFSSDDHFPPRQGERYGNG